MKTRIIRLAIGFTALVASFLPQKAEAIGCFIKCGSDFCFAIGEHAKCECKNGNAVCSA